MINIARAVHVLGVLWWIGGLAMITATVLPALMHSELSETDRQRMLGPLRRRFAWQVRAALLLVGGAGGYMLDRLGGFARLGLAQGWWIDLMLLTWGLFVLMLFVIEPLGLLDKSPLAQRPRAFLALHVFLLVLTLATVACGVVEAHGGFGY
ncbi:MAG TPA: hypothetical protein VFY39_17575 [Gammaproteobacteria bacterium]|nr:hypothetical protein [Gammaproteobacteria bacterium]